MNDNKKESMKVDGLTTSGVRTIQVDFPGNSYASKKAQTEEKKFEKVVKGNVIRKKKSLGKKVQETFLGENIENVVEYIFKDVIIPSIGNMIIDTVQDGIELLINGEVSRNRKRSGSAFQRNPPNQVNYSKMYRPEEKRKTYPVEKYSGINLDEIILETRGDAQDVLNQLIDIIDGDYRQVTIADLCDLLGVTSNYTDNNYGWTNLSRARIVKVPEGYLLDLPRPIQL